jgi:acyl-coenzyme A thioesterase PaaI-like protein
MDQEMLDRIVAVTTAEGTLAHAMGIKILSASGTEVVATMPVAGNVQPYGLLHGGRDGEVTAVATLAHGGRTLATYEIVITDMAGHRVCTSRLTCLIRDQVPGRKANGIDPLHEQGVIGR